jgi:hypothetical protein
MAEGTGCSLRIIEKIRIKRNLETLEGGNPRGSPIM